MRKKEVKGYQMVIVAISRDGDRIGQRGGTVMKGAIFPSCMLLYYLKFFFFVIKRICVVCMLLCMTLCDPLDCSLLSSSVHGISQARILE